MLFCFPLSAALSYPLCDHLVSLCSAQRLCVLCGSIFFAQREVDEEIIIIPFMITWFLCVARSASVYSVVQIVFVQREVNEKKMRK